MKVFPKLWHLGQWQKNLYFIADKGYDCLSVKQLIQQDEHIYVIPRRKNAFFSGVLERYKPLYKTRSAIERFFGRIKENKRLALRFDKLDSTFLSFFRLAFLKDFKLLC